MKPPRGWPSGAAITAVRDGDKLMYTWRFGGSSGTREMTRPKR